MINLRYHIVSITAVFLALGIGLAFGAAFIDRATVEALNSNLTQIENQNDELEAANDDLAQQVLEAATTDLGLRDEGLAQLVGGRLEQVPVLVVTAEGIDDPVVTATEDAVIAAGAQVAAVLRVTERFALDDESELGDLRLALGLPGAGAEQLRTAAVRRVRTLLAEAAGPPAADDTSASVIDPVTLPVPDLIAALASAGFVEIDPTDEPPPGFALIPDQGLRLLVVSGPDAGLAQESFLLPLVRALVAPSPAAPDTAAPLVVAAQPALVPGEGDDDPSFDELQFVALLRADEEVQARLSTVDHLDRFAGLAGAVLALDHGAEGQLGHYGSDDDAQALLPSALPAGG